MHRTGLNIACSLLGAVFIHSNFAFRTFAGRGMHFDSIVIVGATSAIAQATARHLIEHCSCFVLAARDYERLELVATDLRNRGAQRVHTLLFDAEHRWGYDFVERISTLTGGAFPDAALIAHGILPQTTEAFLDREVAQQVIQINTCSVIALCADICRHFEERGRGILAVISSVAADRGRMNNFLYSASKAALDTYLDGLRLRWRSRSHELRVVTIKPGYVRTPMTAHLQRMIGAASPDRVGRAIAQLLLRGSRGKRYIPWWWRPLMAVVRSLPERAMLFIRQ